MLDKRVNGEFPNKSEALRRRGAPARHQFTVDVALAHGSRDFTRYEEELCVPKIDREPAAGERRELPAEGRQPR
jgi:hypothetical protein